MFEFYTNKFKDFTVSSNETVNELISKEHQIGNVIFPLEKVLLNDIVFLLEKAILNKLSSDIQFQKNYWTWGFVTVYYSNFYLAQILNRISDKFYIYINDNLNKEVIYKNNSYEFGQNNRDNTHQREFKLLKSNYSTIKTYGDRRLEPIFDIFNTKNKDSIFKYTIDNEIKESEIRNRINYQLKHYKEINLERKNLDRYKKWYDDIIISNKVNSHYPDYFQLLIINEKRFLFLAMLFNEIKAINPAFKIKIERLSEKINEKYDITFHEVNSSTKALIGELFK